MQDDERRFGNFLRNLKLADARNALEADPVHGVTKFSSLTQVRPAPQSTRPTSARGRLSFEGNHTPKHSAACATARISSSHRPVFVPSFQAEFEKLLLLDNLPQPSALLARAVDSPKYDPLNDGPVAKDWSGALTTPVRDQKDCASGWAFAAASQVESDAQRLLGVRYTLSPQQLLACDDHSEYCAGGWPEAAYAYVRRAGGVERESSYPYASHGGGEPSCKAAVDDFVVGLDAGPASTIARETREATELAMAAHVNATGPLVVCVDATKFSTYVGGVVSDCGSVVNHCLQAVGLRVDASGQGWWRLRNSWGSDWGEGGHVRLAFGADTCAITHRPTFVTPSYTAARLRQARDAD